MADKVAAPIFFKSISHVTAVAEFELGTERVVDGEKYVYAYNCGGSTISARMSTSRPASAHAGLYSISASGSAGDMCAGYVKHVAIPSGEYGWLLKRGVIRAEVASSASDQAVGPKAMGANGVSVSTIAAGLHIVGELLTAIVSGNSGNLFVQLP